MTEEIVAGRNAVFEALTSKRPINKIFIKAGLQGGSLGKIVAAAQEAAIPVEYVQAEKIDRLAPGMRHQGIVALSSPIAFSTLEDVLQRAASRNADTQRGCCGGAWRFIAQAAKLSSEYGGSQGIGRSCELCACGSDREHCSDLAQLTRAGLLGCGRRYGRRKPVF